MSRSLPEEVFFAHFIELGIDVPHCISEPGNDDVLECVDSSVGDFDDDIERDE